MPRKVAQPRPLRSRSRCNDDTKVDMTELKKSTSEIFSEVESICTELCNTKFDEKTVEDVAIVCRILKTHGQELESCMKDRLDHYFVMLQNVANQDRLDALSRLRLIEVTEIKIVGWKVSKNLRNYFKKKFADLEETQKIEMPSFSPQNNFGLVSQASVECVSPIQVPVAPNDLAPPFVGKPMNPT